MYVRVVHEVQIQYCEFKSQRSLLVALGNISSHMVLIHGSRGMNVTSVLETAIFNLVSGTAAGLKFSVLEALHEFFKSRLELRKAVLGIIVTDHHHNLLSCKVWSISLFEESTVNSVRDSLAARGKALSEVLGTSYPSPFWPKKAASKTWRGSVKDLVPLGEAPEAPSMVEASLGARDSPC